MAAAVRMYAARYGTARCARQQKESAAMILHTTPALVVLLSRKICQDSSNWEDTQLPPFHRVERKRHSGGVDRRFILACARYVTSVVEWEREESVRYRPCRVSLLPSSTYCSSADCHRTRHLVSASHANKLHLPISTARLRKGAASQELLGRATADR